MRVTAGEPAIISRDIYLTDQAVTGTALLPAGASPRVIDLDPGTYVWTFYLSDSKPTVPFEQVFTLSQRGRYNWRCYLTGTGVPWSETTYNYKGNCLLRPHDSTKADIWLPVNSTSRILYRRYKGTFYWESKLFLNR